MILKLTLMEVLGIIITLVILLVLYYQWIFLYWDRKNVRTLRPNLLLGNLTNVIFRRVPVFSLFQEIYNTCITRQEKYMGFYFFTKPGLVVVDPELLKIILIKDFNVFSERPFYKNEKSDPLSVHLVSSSGEKWKLSKERLTPAFTSKKLKVMYRTLLKVNDHLIKVLNQFSSNEEPVNLLKVVNKYIVDSIGMIIFGIECNTLNGVNLEFNNYTQRVVGGSAIMCLKFSLCTLCPSILNIFKVSVFPKDVENFFINLTRNTIEHREKYNIIRNDMMHLMIQLKNNINIENDITSDVLNSDTKEKVMNIEEIAAEMMIFFAASYETCSSAIIFLVYELVTNPDIEYKLREEIFDALEPQNGEITYDAIAKMDYLNKCVLETLRKYPSVSFIGRRCSETYKVPDSDLIIDKGTIIYIPVAEIHADSRYYPNPTIFNPDRFSTENKLKRPSNTFLSFGDGPRECIGQRLGILYIKFFIVTLIKHYNFTLYSRSKPPFNLNKNSIFMSFSDEIYFYIKKI